MYSDYVKFAPVNLTYKEWINKGDQKMKRLEELKKLNNKKVNEELLDELLESEFVIDYNYMTSGQWIDHMVYTLFLEDGEEIEVYYKHN